MFFAYNPVACYTYTSQSGGEESRPEEEKQAEQIIAFLPLCLFPGADECEEKRHRSVGLGSVVLVRQGRPHQLRELSQTQPFNLGLLTFSLFCSLSSIVVPAERRFKERKKNYFGNNMAEEEVDIDLADPEVILHFSSLTY